MCILFLCQQFLKKSQQRCIQNFSFIHTLSVCFLIHIWTLFQLCGGYFYLNQSDQWCKTTTRSNNKRTPRNTHTSNVWKILIKFTIREFSIIVYFLLTCWNSECVKLTDSLWVLLLTSLRYFWGYGCIFRIYLTKHMLSLSNITKDCQIWGNLNLQPKILMDALNFSIFVKYPRQF